MADQHTLHVIVLDLDDTLYPESQYVRSGYVAVAAHLRDRLARADRFEDYLWDRFQGGQRQRLFNLLSEEFRLDLSAEQIGELVSVYRDHRPTIQMFPGMPDLLATLRRTYRLAILSDGFLPAQQYKLDALAVSHFFDYVLFTETMGREFWKPSPAPFRKLCMDMGVEPARCAYIGDNPIKDFLAPNELGWRTIQYRRPGQVHAENPSPEGGAAQHVVDSEAQLLAALE